MWCGRSQLHAEYLLDSAAYKLSHCGCCWHVVKLQGAAVNHHYAPQKHQWGVSPPQHQLAGRTWSACCPSSSSCAALGSSLMRCHAVLCGQVISTNGDTHLGGEDFDQRVMEYFIKLIKKKYSKDISGDARALQKLRREAERAKRALSSQHQVRGVFETVIGCVGWQLETASGA